MQYVSDTQILTAENKKKIRELEQQKYATAKVNLEVKEKLEPLKKKNPLDVMNYINGLSKQQEREKPKEKQITANDILKNLEIKKLLENNKKKELEQLLDKGEIKEVKEGAVNLMAYAHFDPIKRKLFERRLKRSEIVDEYVNNSFILQYFNEANNHLKFAFAYGLNYMQTNDDYDQLLLLQQMRQNNAQTSEEPQNNPAPEPKTPAPESESDNEKSDSESD